MADLPAPLPAPANTAQNQPANPAHADPAAPAPNQPAPAAHQTIHQQVLN